MTDVVSLEVRAEQLKLGRTLGVPAHELEFLAGATPADLRVLRERIGDDLFERDAHHFAGMIKLARRLPVGLSAQVAQHALGPELAARAATLLDPAMTVEFVKRLPAKFLADVAAAADVARLAPQLAALPADKIGAVAAELAAREEWIPMGAFVSHLRLDQLDAALAALDAEALLRTGFVMDDKSRVDAVFARIGDAQLDDYLRTAVRLDLLPEALDLAAHLSAKGRKRLAKRLDGLSDAELAALAARVRSERVLRDAAEPLLAVASERVRAASDSQAQ